jgi:hypothetical protein
VKNGFGWVYRQYCKEKFCQDWQELEHVAKTSKRGLWAESTPMPPWEFRHQQRNQNGSTIQDTYSRKSGTNVDNTYHGNIKSQVFHTPNCKDYNCKNCTVKFRSTEEATKAGYRIHTGCAK